MNRIATRQAPGPEDRELLEVILNAIHLKCKWSDKNGFERYDTGASWNPLIDDGDALRLAVKLGILELVVKKVEARDVTLGCAYERTRRAIVEVAVEVCKQSSQSKSLDSWKSQQ